MPRRLFDFSIKYIILVTWKYYLKNLLLLITTRLLFLVLNLKGFSFKLCNKKSLLILSTKSRLLLNNSLIYLQSRNLLDYDCRKRIYTCLEVKSLKIKQIILYRRNNIGNYPLILPTAYRSRVYLLKRFPLIETLDFFKSNYLF